MRSDILSIVVPCYNESEVLNETALQLTSLLESFIDQKLVDEQSFILFVNDGSKDNTWTKIEDLYQSGSRICGLNLAANVGHQNALLSGLELAAKHSDIIVSIDADLQDDIAVIEDMIQAYKQGSDIVYGVRSARKTDTWFKRTSAQTFYRLMQILGVKTVYNHADYRLMSKRAAEQLMEYHEKNLFLRGLVPLLGYQTSHVYYERKERMAGESKYPFRKMMNFALDGITSFSVRPVRFIFYVGVLSFVLSFIAAVYFLVDYFKGNTVPGWTSLILSIWFLGAMILISIGIIGEYIGKIYMEVKNRPRYYVESILMQKNKKK